MAGNTDADKATLIAEIAATRVRMIVATERVRESMDLPTRARQSFQRHRGAWLGTAAVAGLILIQLVRRKKVVYVERSTGDILGAAGKAGLVWSGVKLLGGLAKPMFGEFAKARLHDLLVRFAQRRASHSAEHRGNM
jgi:hypothetical protein